MPMAAVQQEVLSRTRLGRSDEISDGASKVFAVGDREIAVFRRGDEVFAIDDHCPHKKASLAAGACTDAAVACPWHGWKFDLRTGESLDHPGFRVATHSIEESDGDLWIEVVEERSDLRGQESEKSGTDDSSHTTGDDSAILEEWKDAFRGLVRYGAMAWLGYFRSAEKFEFRRGERVLIQTSRGIEVGELLAPVTSDPPRNEEGRVLAPAGELLRRLNSMETFEVARRQRDERTSSTVREMLTECERCIEERKLSISIVDGELLFDRKVLVFYFLGAATADLGRLAAELSEDREFKVVFNSVLELPETSGNSCGCSSGGGGCCSMASSSVESATVG